MTMLVSKRKHQTFSEYIKTKAMEKREKDDKRESRLLKHKEWAMNRQLTWAGLFLASMVGIIELLPEIKPISTEISPLTYTLDLSRYYLFEF